MRMLCAFLCSMIPVLAQPASLAGVQDQGTFDLFQNDVKLATIPFVWTPDGKYHSEVTISMAGQTVKQDFTITPDADGRWIRYEAHAPVGTMTGERAGDVLTRTFKDKIVTVNLKPNVMIFENMSPALTTLMVRAYDEKKGGKQTFPMLIVPGGVAADVTVEKGPNVEKFSRYTLGLPNVEMSLVADSAGKVYLAEVPSQHAYIVREGYESLHSASVVDPTVSAPKFTVKIERNLKIPMRDGVALVADVYRPDTNEKLPIVLVRTPYQKNMMELQGNYYAKRGYAYVVQDVRGRFGSGGVWEPFVNEAKDGYDSVEWLAKQPWATGKVGMIGGSYVGWVQWWAAAQKPPHLTTIIPNVSPPDPFYNVPYEYGAFFLLGALSWAEIVESNATADISGVAMSKLGDIKWSKVLRTLPVIDLDKPIFGKENPYWRQWIKHSSDDDYWAPSDFLAKLKDVNLPVFHQSGWFDGDGIGTKLNYERMAAHHAANQKLVLGPWPHTDESQQHAMGRDFGPQALFDLRREYVRWFDHWLKGMDNGIEKEPLVRIFAMGSNKWLTGNTYPLPETKYEKWYLASAAQANTAKGDGTLARALPSGAGADKFTYDPGDPTPDPELYDPDQDDKKGPQASEEMKKKAEAYHDEVIGSRKDILVYTTAPFDKPYTFAGPMSATLYASSSARDTDWFMTLYELDKEGKYLKLGRGKIRARYRKSVQKAELLKPGEVYEYTLDLWHTGITIPVGSRLRVEVASAVFPMFSRNLNTGGANEMETKYVSAQQVIYHDASHASYLSLPMIQASDPK